MWRCVKYFILGLILTGVPGTLVALSIKPEPRVLAEEVAVKPTLTLTPTPTPMATPYPTETPLPTPTFIPTPTPIPIPTMAPSEINAQIDGFAGQFAVDPNVLRHIAICESGFNPLVVNGGYVGLFQFGPVTWKNLRAQIGENTDPDLRFSAIESIKTAAYALSQGKNDIWPNCHP